MVNNGNLMPHMMVFVFEYNINNQNGPIYFPKFGVVQTVKLTTNV